jgi:Ferric reductase like transmembrane component
MFILLPMLRLSVTKLRQKGLNFLLPLDKHVSFHALTGKLIGLYSLIHTIAHIVNLGKNIHFNKKNIAPLGGFKTLFTTLRKKSSKDFKITL